MNCGGTTTALHTHHFDCVSAAVFSEAADRSCVVQRVIAVTVSCGRGVSVENDLGQRGNLQFGNLDL